MSWIGNLAKKNGDNARNQGEPHPDAKLNQEEWSFKAKDLIFREDVQIKIDQMKILICWQENNNKKYYSISWHEKEIFEFRKCLDEIIKSMIEKRICSKPVKPDLWKDQAAPSSYNFLEGKDHT